MFIEEVDYRSHSLHTQVYIIFQNKWKQFSQQYDKQNYFFVRFASEKTGYNNN